ncbi:MAG: PAS domain-containing protein, partial [Anaerolineae bacterium]|nr:PAS domain-containing protein [Anaerolineae bacterium]
KWLTRRNQLLLWIIPSLTLVLALTNEWHHLHWESIRVSSERLPEVTRGRVLIYDAAPLAWVFVAYSYVLLIGSIAALLDFALHTARVYQQQARLLLLATLIALFGDLLYQLEIIPVEITPVTITLAGLLTAWNITRFRLMEIVPIAREVLFEHLHDGVLIINPSGRIADLNPEAERMLDRHIFIGQPIETALKAYPELLSVYRDESEREIEVGPLILEIRATRLIAPRHQVVGHLMTLRDVTLRKKTEDALQENVENLSLLRQIDNELNRSLALEVVLDIAVDAVIRGSRAVDGFIAVIEENTLVSARGFGGYYEVQTFQWEKGIIGRVLRTQQPEWVREVSIDSDYFAQLAHTRAQIVFP